MNITVDNDRRVLRIEEAGSSREISLFTPEAFECVSREWLRIGWALRYYHTFTWFGRPILQLPDDLIRLQEVIYDVRPDVLIETGVFDGGSLLFHASLAEALGNGRVIGIELELRHGLAESIHSHPLSNRISLIEGDSTAPATVGRVRELIRPGEKVMVILDSDHSRAHVAAELEVYAPLVSIGSWIVAADGIMHELADVPAGEPSWKDDNPSAAAREFAVRHPEFVLGPPAWKVNTGPLSQNVTYWPDGWLRRIA